MLVEIIIVLLIIAVVVSFAVPVYTAQLKKGYQLEALRNLESARAAMVRRYSRYGTYAGAQMNLLGCNLDFCPESQGGGANVAGQTLHYRYELIAVGQTTFYLCAASAPTLNYTETVCIDQTGNIDFIDHALVGGGPPQD